MKITEIITNELTGGKELKCVNIIIQGEECLITLSNFDEEDQSVRTFNSSRVSQAIQYAETLSYEYDLPMKLYFGHVVFREEYPSRKLSRLS